MSKHLSNVTSVSNRSILRAGCFVLAVALGSFTFLSSSFAQQRLASQATFVTPIQWSKQKRVTKYRLQIATDDRFSDVIFDGPVVGEQYFVRDLSPGRYYWRVAPSDFQTGEFLKPVAFDVAGALAETHKTPERTSPTFPGRANGWLATTGDIATPITATLRTGLAPDFIGVNAQGTVYAVNSSNGVALWSARYGSNPLSKTPTPVTPFRPLLLTAQKGLSYFPIAIVAYDGGVRALNSATGRELWRTSLRGSAVAGATIKAISTVGKAYLVVTNKERGDALVVLNASSGRIEAEKRLNGFVSDNVTGPPVWFGNKNSPRLLLPLSGNVIAVYDSAGQLLRSTKLDAEITAAPVIVDTSRGEAMLVGTRKGLAVYSVQRDAAEFRFLQYVGTSDGQAINSISVAEVDGNNAPMVVAITNRGRVLLIDPDQMTTRWTADVAGENSAASFADVNGDGRLEILLPAKDGFAVGLSGTDGSVIWKSPTGMSKQAAVRTNVERRALAVARLSTGRLILVGSDGTSGGLRAIEVVPASLTSSVR